MCTFFDGIRFFAHLPSFHKICDSFLVVSSILAVVLENKVLRNANKAEWLGDLSSQSSEKNRVKSIITTVA